MKLSTAFLLGATALAGVVSFGETAQAIPFASGSIAFQATTNTTTNLCDDDAVQPEQPDQLGLRRDRLLGRSRDEPDHRLRPSAA